MKMAFDVRREMYPLQLSVDAGYDLGHQSEDEAMLPPPAKKCGEKGVVRELIGRRGAEGRHAEMGDVTNLMQRGRREVVQSRCSMRRRRR